MSSFAPAQLLWVGLGGCAGSMLRFAVQQVVQRTLTPSAFPWGTLAVNLLGCFAIGLAVGWAGSDDAFSANVRLFLLVGLFGGFTTFSAFGLDTFGFLHEGAWGSALLNAGLQLGGGLLAVAVGYAAGRWI